MQCNKVLITLSPYNTVTVCCGAQCYLKSPNIRMYSEQWQSGEYKETWIFRSFHQYFKLGVTPIAVHYFHMNTDKPKLKGLSESRFGSMIFLLRMAGISLQMKKVSTIYAVYMITVVICSYSTFIGMFVDVYINWDDLGSSMTTVRVLIPFTSVMWIFSYCR